MDEIYRVLRELWLPTVLNYNELLKELRDLSTMAIEHFVTHIVPNFQRTNLSRFIESNNKNDKNKTSYIHFVSRLVKAQENASGSQLSDTSSSMVDSTRKNLINSYCTTFKRKADFVSSSSVKSELQQQQSSINCNQQNIVDLQSKALIFVYININVFYIINILIAPQNPLLGGPVRNSNHTKW